MDFFGEESVEKEQKVTVEQVVEILNHFSVMDLAELKKALEESWGVEASSAHPMMMAALPGEGGGQSASAEAEQEEPTEFQVILEEVPSDKKIAAIKVVKDATGLTLKEARDLVDNIPKPVKEHLPKGEAEELQGKLRDIGAKVALKGM